MPWISNISSIIYISNGRTYQICQHNISIGSYSHICKFFDKGHILDNWMQQEMYMQYYKVCVFERDKGNRGKAKREWGREKR